MFIFLTTIKNTIIKYERYIFYISVFLSLLTIYLSLFDFIKILKCCEFSGGLQDFAILLEECALCPDIRHDTKPIWYLFFGTYILCGVLYFVFKSLEIKYFFDRYLFATTLLTMSLALTSYTSFSYTKFYNYYYNILLIFIIFCGFSNLIQNFNYYNKTFKKIIYMFCLFIYHNFLFWSFTFFTLYRCVGACL